MVACIIYRCGVHDPQEVFSFRTEVNIVAASVPKQPRSEPRDGPADYQSLGPCSFRVMLCGHSPNITVSDLLDSTFLLILHKIGQRMAIERAREAEDMIPSRYSLQRRAAPRDSPHQWAAETNRGRNSFIWACLREHQDTCHKPFWTHTSSYEYEWKSQKVEIEPRIQKKLIPKIIFRRREVQKNGFCLQK